VPARACFQLSLSVSALLGRSCLATLVSTLTSIYLCAALWNIGNLMASNRRSYDCSKCVYLCGAVKTNVKSTTAIILTAAGINITNLTQRYYATRIAFLLPRCISCGKLRPSDFRQSFNLYLGESRRQTARAFVFNHNGVKPLRGLGNSF